MTTTDQPTTQQTITTRTLRRLTATAHPLRVAIDVAPTPHDRLRAMAALLGDNRCGAGGDYHPADADFIAAWECTRTRIAVDGDAALDHLDEFLRIHHDTLRDLALRAQCGHAPPRLLDGIAVAIAQQLRVA